MSMTLDQQADTTVAVPAKLPDHRGVPPLDVRHPSALLGCDAGDPVKPHEALYIWSRSRNNFYGPARYEEVAAGLRARLVVGTDEFWMRGLNRWLPVSQIRRPGQPASPAKRVRPSGSRGRERARRHSPQPPPPDDRPRADGLRRLLAKYSTKSGFVSARLAIERLSRLRLPDREKTREKLRQIEFLFFELPTVAPWPSDRLERLQEAAAAWTAKVSGLAPRFSLAKFSRNLKPLLEDLMKSVNSVIPDQTAATKPAEAKTSTSRGSAHPEKKAPKMPVDSPDLNGTAEQERLVELRSALSRALEQARADKIINSNLEATVTLQISDAQWLDQWRPFLAEFEKIFILSELHLEPGKDDAVTVTKTGATDLAAPTSTARLALSLADAAPVAEKISAHTMPAPTSVSAKPDSAGPENKASASPTPPSAKVTPTPTPAPSDPVAKAKPAAAAPAKPATPPAKAPPTPSPASPATKAKPAPPPANPAPPTSAAQPAPAPTQPAKAAPAPAAAAPAPPSSAKPAAAPTQPAQATPAPKATPAAVTPTPAAANPAQPNPKDPKAPPAPPPAAPPAPAAATSDTTSPSPSTAAPTSPESESVTSEPAEEAAVDGSVELVPVGSEQEGKPRSMLVLVMRALGRIPQEFPLRTLARHVPATVIPGPAAPPPPRRPGFIRRHLLFSFSVLLPTALAAFYFIFLASDIYVSESRFVVRTPNQQTGGGLNAVLQGTGFGSFSKAPEDVYTVSQYAMSRAAVDRLDEQLSLKATWGSRDIDMMRRFNPLGWSGSSEALFEYYPRRVGVAVDPNSSITTLTVSVFSPEQAFRINEILLGEAEKLVNVLNDRARNDLIRFAENEVRLAEERAKEAARAVSDYRNTEAVVDPEKQTELHFQHISRLQEELMRTEAQLAQLRVFAPDSPHPPSLEVRIKTLKNEIEKEMQKITGGENSLASKAAQYERLALEREFADRQLAGALTALELARNEAQRQQLYLETIAKPSLPDGPLYPRRFRGILTTFVLGLVAWGILSMLVAGVREHQY